MTAAVAVLDDRRDAAELRTVALLSAIFNSANFSSIATYERGVIQIFNVGAERMLGYAADEVMNRLTPADLSDPKELVLRASVLSAEFYMPISPGFEALVFKAARGIEDIYELTYVRKDGTRLPAVVSVTALRDAGGSILGYLLIGTVNTARNKAEAALVEAGALQAAIFNSATFSLIATDERGVIQIFNVGAERMLGYSAAEVVDTLTPADLHDGDEIVTRAQGLTVEYATPIAPGFEALVFKAARGIDDVYEVTKVRKDRSRFPAVVSVTALRDPYGGIIGYLLIGTDNTARKEAEAERKRAEDTLRQAMIVAEAANEELAAFSYSVSHDLRAPLRAIDGFSLALSEDHAEQLDAEAHHDLDRIRAGVQKMGKLIDDLLELAGVTRSDIKTGRVDLSAVFREVVEDLRAAEPLREVEVVIEDGLIVEGDTRLLRIAAVNLVGNAWKFTGTTAAPRIEIGRAIDDGTTSYFVRDNGVGFDMAYAHKLFGAFQRLHAATEFPGTGIGLATVRRIVARHGGKTWAVGALGTGATLSFTLA